MSSELWAKSGEKPGLRVGGRGPEVERLGFLSLLIFLSWPSKKAVAPHPHVAYLLQAHTTLPLVIPSLECSLASPCGTEGFVLPQGPCEM